MCRIFVWAIAVALVMMTGCGERGGNMFPIPHIPTDERIQNPTEADVIGDLMEFYPDLVNAEVVEETHSVESHVFFVRVDSDGEIVWFKITYYFLQGEWIFLPDQIEV